MKEKIIRYRGRNIVVGFNPERCTHVAECLRGLPDVFDNSHKPWVDPNAASPVDVAGVIMRCPTGALHFHRTDGGPEETIPSENRILIAEDGPLYLSGDIEIVSSGGEPIIRDTRIALCRCGASQHMPFCDGRHFFSGFEDSKKEKMAEGCAQSMGQTEIMGALTVTPMPDGPLRISGPFTLESENHGGKIRTDRALLCRCGVSKAKPFCDGSHTKIRFDTGKSSDGKSGHASQ
jgi:CDGSH-type Zn-finger protein/uncharacterized Fe-S cluster protein YjdI